MTVDRVGGRAELPEAIGVIDVRVPDVAASGLDNILIDKPKCIEGLSFVWVILVFVAAEVGGEELLVRLDFRLRDHVLDWRLRRYWLDSIDPALCNR